MKIGYARVSKDEGQDNDAQIAALKRAGCKRIFRDQGSGADIELPGRRHALDALKKGDTLVVWKIDRFSRSLLHLCQFLVAIDAAGASFHSITERAIDTRNAGGKMLLQILGSFAEFERSQIIARTRLGLDLARRRGVRLGPPHKLDGPKIDSAIELLKTQTIAQVAHALNVGTATLKRALRRRRDAAMKETLEKVRKDGQKNARKTHKTGTPRRTDRRRR